MTVQIEIGYGVSLVYRLAVCQHDRDADVPGVSSNPNYRKIWEQEKQGASLVF